MLALSIKQDVPGLSQLALASVACSIGRQLNRPGLTPKVAGGNDLLGQYYQVRIFFLSVVFFTVFQNKLLGFIHLTPREVRFDLTVKNIDIMSQTVELKFRQCVFYVRLSFVQKSLRFFSVE